MFKIIYKESGISSFSCIKNYAKKNNIKKIGHSGTLDPLAKGLMLIASDEDTKFFELIKNTDKEYIVRSKLGFSSTTMDADGEITKINSHQKITKKDLLTLIKSFLGKQEQLPPKYSAKKINGKRAYSLANKGLEFEIKSSTIEIKKISLINFEFHKQEFTIKTLVSSGTYVRSLISDIAKKLNSDAYVLELERTKIHNLKSKKQDKEIKPTKLLKFKKINVNKKHLKLIFQGHKNVFTNLKNEKYLFFFNKIFLGVIYMENNLIIKRKIKGVTIDKILQQRS